MKYDALFIKNERRIIYEKNLTSGSVLKNIIWFSLPYLLAYFLQSLYGMADLYIVGQFEKVNHVTAVSIGSQVMHMITVIIVGLAMGSTVHIGQSIGAKKKELTSQIIGNTVKIFLIGSLFFSSILLLLSNNIVMVMSTPIEAIAHTKRYLTICFIGIPFITAYNVLSSIFRGMGDFKSPMYFVAISCFTNIILDYYFIGIMKLGATGAALGTTISQTLSVMIALYMMTKRNVGIQIKKEDFKIARSILKTGIPIALQDGFIQVAFLIITIIANSRGLNDAAAVGIVEKIIGMLF